MIHDDLGQVGMAGSCVYRQKALHSDQTHVDADLGEVLDKLGILQSQDLVDYLDVSAQGQHVAVVVFGHQFFYDVDQNPKAVLA